MNHSKDIKRKYPNGFSKRCSHDLMLQLWLKKKCPNENQGCARWVSALPSEHLILRSVIPVHFLTAVILTESLWNLDIVLICISLDGLRIEGLSLFLSLSLSLFF